jgi:Tfp pilus assembly protein PilZ
MSENPRRFMRHPVSVEFRAHEANQAQHGDILFDVLNMSQGGAFLRSDVLLDIGTSLEIGLPFEFLQGAVTGRVAWVTRGDKDQAAGMGIEFVGLDDMQQSKLNAWIESHKQG